MQGIEKKIFLSDEANADEATIKVLLGDKKFNFLVPKRSLIDIGIHGEVTIVKYAGLEFSSHKKDIRNEREIKGTINIIWLNNYGSRKNSGMISAKLLGVQSVKSMRNEAQLNAISIRTEEELVMVEYAPDLYTGSLY